MTTARSFRFRPRYRGVALTAIGLGGSLSAVSAIWVGLAVTVPLISGLVGLGLGAVYLASPAWKLTLTLDDDGLEVGTPRARRFRLAWADVVGVVASPTTTSCFVDGGAPERSLLVPGDGAPAPYDLDDKATIYATIVAHVDPAKVRIVESLDRAPKA